MSFESQPGGESGRGNLVAVLGPTNTGKTHLAIERMLGHQSGMIGLPLRLLAAEVYGRLAARVGPDAVALITGEEKIVPDTARYRVCTVEAMPVDLDVAFLAIDEIQLVGDFERGHVFTDRMLHLRGRDETLLLGAETMHGTVERLFPGINVVTRPRMSLLTYAGPKKITRLPRRSAVVAFSSNDVYAIAELIRRQRGGAAVVLGSLSPRARNAQVELFQSGDVDFLVATDAIGMGLNLDVDHVAFAADSKFDGFQFRKLTPAELGQIAGRAGRHTRDGTFGITGRVDPFSDELVRSLENHAFSPVKTAQWRNRDLDFATIDSLKDSLEQGASHPSLTKAPKTTDVTSLEAASRLAEIRGLADRPDRVSLLWDVCQIPDYRKIAPANHNELVATLFGFLVRDGSISEDWFGQQVNYADRTDGDIDTLANRMAHIRTWTYAANRTSWLVDPGHWQERTRAIEDRLSDALHERLTERFVDRRTSVLMRRLKENAMLDAEIADSGDVLVEGQHIGTLAGFRFAPDAGANGPDAKALRAAAAKALAGEIARRADRVAAAPDSDFVLSADGTLRWQGAVIARLAEGDDPLRPRLVVLADDSIASASRERVQTRIDLWLTTRITTLLKPLFDLKTAETLAPAARGIAFQLSERFGVIDRNDIAEEVRNLDQDARAGLRALGVRFGAYHIYIPQLLKPAPGALIATLFAMRNGGSEHVGDLTTLAASGRTSVKVNPDIPRDLYRVAGYRVAGKMAVRLDILERLADLIRPLIAWRPNAEATEPPEGAIEGNGFTVTVAMTSLLGCSGEDFASVLESLGYRMERKPKPEDTGEARSGSAPEQPETAAEPAPAETESATGSNDDEPSDPKPDASEPAPETMTDAAPVPASEAAQGAEPASPPPSVEATAEPAEERVPDVEPPSAENASAPEGEEAKATEEAAGEATVEEATAEGGEAEPAEPAFIEIWRPVRRNRQQRGRRDDRGAGKREGGGGSKDARDKDARQGRPPGGRRGKPQRRDGGGGGKGGPNRNRPPQDKKPAKKIDPDSPFAKLAALKAQMESRNEDG